MPRLLRSLSLAAIAAMPACGGGDSGAGPGDDPGDTVRPSVIWVYPSHNATGVAVTTDIEFAFSEPMDWSSVGSSSVTIVPGVSGTFSHGEDDVTFTPASNLAWSTTYTVTVSTAARDTAGNPLSASRAWSFTTQSEPISVPLDAGYRLTYRQQDTTTVCAWSTGCSTSRFDGSHYVEIGSGTSWNGRFAHPARVYTFENVTSGTGFSSQTIYLYQTSGGLERWGTSSWKRIYSTSASAFSGGDFFLTQGPSYDDAMTQTTSSVNVPAGSYGTIRVEHDYRVTGQYEPRDIFVTEVEHWAPGVGAVYGFWNFYLDDNDPQAADVTRRGSYWLTNINSGPFPTILFESESNDSTNTADAGGVFMAAQGNTLLGDAGAVMSSSAVGCGATDCIAPDNNGVRRISDWYEVPVSSAATVRLALSFTGSSNDLDLYLFRATTGGLSYVNRSVNGAGEAESITVSLTAGTYYVAVQAWDTPGGRTPYTVVMR